MKFQNFLIAKKLLDEDELERAQAFSTQNGCSLYTSLRELSFIDPEPLAQNIAEFHKVPLLSDVMTSLDEAAPLEGLSVAFLREHNVVPIKDAEDGIILAVEAPDDAETINAIRLALKKRIYPVVAPAGVIQAIIDQSSEGLTQNNHTWSDADTGEEFDGDVEHLRDIALETPVVRFVNDLIEDAIRRRATDIHVEPFSEQLIVRMRIDGLLREVSSPPAHMGKAIVSRVKILSGLDIAERRLPQDGRSRVQIGHHRLDLRVATIPTVGGEAVAIRLLDNVRRVLDFSKLGFSQRDEDVLRTNLNSPYGLILVTGPTGSGKTTTLATALTELNQTERKILTVEDPIEYEIEGINQTQTKAEIGLTFGAALRSFLRHDPDVLMVGEIRDGETAGIAVNAALTGHLVLSTLHTNSAVGAIPRLMDMGVDPFLLASTLRCVVAQRLVRVLCPHCKTAADDHTGVLDGPAAHASAKGASYVPRGCDRCSGSGYLDRMVISEVLHIDDNVRAHIKPDIEPWAIEQAARRSGMRSMYDDGLEKCAAGLTTEQEVRRAAVDL